jgi:hypothetical protein
VSIDIDLADTIVSLCRGTLVGYYVALVGMN